MYLTALLLAHYALNERETFFHPVLILDHQKHSLVIEAERGRFTVYFSRVNPTPHFLLFLQCFENRSDVFATTDLKTDNNQRLNVSIVLKPDCKSSGLGVNVFSIEQRASGNDADEEVDRRT